MSQEITFEDFMNVEIRVGTVIKAVPFPEARKPAFKMVIDFGDAIGQKKSSAQITVHYEIEDLVGRQVMAGDKLSSPSNRTFHVGSVDAWIC